MLSCDHDAIVVLVGVDVSNSGGRVFDRSGAVLRVLCFRGEPKVCDFDACRITVVTVIDCHLRRYGAAFAFPSVSVRSLDSPVNDYSPVSPFCFRPGPDEAFSASLCSCLERFFWGSERVVNCRRASASCSSLPGIMPTA